MAKVLITKAQGYTTTLVIEGDDGGINMEQVEVKETKEVLVGLLKITALLAKSFKDGIQAQDIAVVIAKIAEDEAIKKLLLEAYNGVDKVPAEIKDLSFKEGFELMTVAVPELIEIINSLKA